MNEMTKLLVKIHDGDGKAAKWVHLCYIDSELFSKFTTIAQYSTNDYLKQWILEDFGTDVLSEKNDLISSKSLLKFRELICKRYKNQYPDLCRQSKTDRQGWVRVWVSEHIRKELNQHGKENNER